MLGFSIPTILLLRLLKLRVFLHSCTGTWTDYVSLSLIFPCMHLVSHCLAIKWCFNHTSVLCLLLNPYFQLWPCSGKMHAKQMQCSRWWDNWWPVKWPLQFPSLHSGSQNNPVLICAVMPRSPCWVLLIQNFLYARSGLPPQCEQLCWLLPRCFPLLRWRCTTDKRSGWWSVVNVNCNCWLQVGITL